MSIVKPSTNLNGLVSKVKPALNLLQDKCNVKTKTKQSPIYLHVLALFKANLKQNLFGSAYVLQLYGTI